jgi:hypothetical protein
MNQEIRSTRSSLHNLASTFIMQIHRDRPNNLPHTPGRMFQIPSYLYILEKELYFVWSESSNLRPDMDLLRVVQYVSNFIAAAG